jgi:hypothetical protein
MDNNGLVSIQVAPLNRNPPSNPKIDLLSKKKKKRKRKSFCNILLSPNNAPDSHVH